MEWATPRKAADGTPITGADGLWEKGEVVRIDVMRREAGYGAAYGDKRAGEWEFASYKPDGSPFEPKIDAAACAACHRKPGTARDFVFRGRFPAQPTRCSGVTFARGSTRPRPLLPDRRPPFGPSTRACSAPASSSQ